MKKNTFYSLLFVGMLTGCAIVESSPVYSSEAIRNAELSQDYATDQEREAYYITLFNDSIQVIDPTTGEEIYKEDGNGKTGLSEAILKDNE